VFGCWFSFFNGLTQAAQNIYPRDVLGLGVLPMSLLRTGMRVGQLVITPAVGRAADRRGNRWVLAVSQALVGAGPLFFLLATPERPWWIVGAWVVWIAYAGTNVCLPNLALALSPVHDRTAHLAAHFALTSLAYAGMAGRSPLVAGPGTLAPRRLRRAVPRRLDRPHRDRLLAAPRAGAAIVGQFG
jgi:MFS family permease